MIIQIVDEAIQELEEAIEFYKKQVTGLGLDLEFEVRQAFPYTVSINLRF